MRDQDWIRFENTGRIWDYLSYRNGQDHDFHDLMISKRVPKEKEGSGKNGAEYDTYRHDIISGSHRGI